jgi:hypothetical protein
MVEMMKIFALPRILLAVALFMVFSPAIAQVCLDVDGTTATGIRDLEVITDEYGLIFIDVDFRLTTGFDIYGPDLDNMPFDPLSSEDDVAAVELQINNALDAVTPDVPLYVGEPGETSYYIGVDEEEVVVIALGSENLTGLFWDPCTDFSDCLAGVRVLPAGTTFIYADLSVRSGIACGIDKPPPVWPPPKPEPELPPTVGNIPTLSGWALITLSIIFGLTVFAKRRRLFKR